MASCIALLYDLVALCSLYFQKKFTISFLLFCPVQKKIKFPIPSMNATSLYYIIIHHRYPSLFITINNHHDQSSSRVVQKKTHHPNIYTIDKVTTSFLSYSLYSPATQVVVGATFEGQSIEIVQISRDCVHQII